jgi:L-threonylcarbamoyladenylate synthase
VTKPPATRILPTHTPALFAAAVREAAALLRAGEAVALPTETVYGLAANAWDPQAVERIFAIKGRPAHNPVILHVASLDMARACVRSLPAGVVPLARAFWPGPLTLVMTKSDRVPAAVTAGGETVGIRWPSHPFMQAVIRECGFPLAAPSANLSNRLSPTTSAHVASQLAGRVQLIVDGGASAIGIESTVLDVTSKPARILRPGMVHAESLTAVIGAVAEGADSGATLRSPGLLAQHYAPQARLQTLQWTSDADLRRAADAAGIAPGRTHVLAHSAIPGGEGFGRVSVIPHDPEAFARALYAELHRCDELGAELILVEAPPASHEWRGIADRLRRAGA